MNNTTLKPPHKTKGKKVCLFPDLTAFEIEAITEAQGAKKVSYRSEGVLQTVWLPNEFVC
jgi:hypothetical protein